MFNVNLKTNFSKISFLYNKYNIHIHKQVKNSCSNKTHISSLTLQWPKRSSRVWRVRKLVQQRLVYGTYSVYSTWKLMFLDFYVKFTHAEGKFLKCNTVYSSNQIKWRERVRAPPWRWNPPMSLCQRRLKQRCLYLIKKSSKSPFLAAARVLTVAV